MKKYWPLMLGLVIAAIGSLIVWQDIGSLSTGRILQVFGLILAAWNVFRLGGG